jgi:hypothetical protein
MATTSLYLKLVANLQLKPTTAQQATASEGLDALERRDAANSISPGGREAGATRRCDLQNLLCFDMLRDFDCNRRGG